MKRRLTIDIGNTRTKYGIFEASEILQFGILENEELENNNELIQSFGVASVIVSSVNSAAEEKLKLNQLPVPLLNLTYQTALPIQLDYQSPETLGKDRIAAVVGAYCQFPNHHLLVIDAGTCVTYDFLTEEKEYLGGAISPGVQMRLRAMSDFTSKLPLIHWGGKERPQNVGRSTITSMLSGAVNGLIAEMNGLILNYEKQYPELKIAITGGDANFFEKELKNGIFADPNLVLKGLNEILIYNGK